MRRHTPNGIAEYDNVSMNIRVRKIDIVLAAVDCRSRPQRPDSVAGVRGLELRNVALQNAGPNSLVFQNILVPETFREDRFRLRRLKRHLQFESFHLSHTIGLCRRYRPGMGYSVDSKSSLIEERAGKIAEAARVLIGSCIISCPVAP